jgi:hypothetical protein
MKYIFSILAIIMIFISCEQSEIEIYEYEWRWNIESNPEMICSGFDNNLSNADLIKIEITSDSNETHNFADYKISRNELILTAPVEFQTEDFNDPDLIRLVIKLIHYN